MEVNCSAVIIFCLVVGKGQVLKEVFSGTVEYINRTTIIGSIVTYKISVFNCVTGKFVLTNAPLTYNAPPFLAAELFMNLQLSIAIPETSLLNMTAPPNSELPFINVIFLRTTSEAVILNILDFSNH